MDHDARTRRSTIFLRRHILCMHTHPVEPLDQRTKLCGRQPNRAVLDLRLAEPTVLQRLDEQAKPRAVPEHEFDAVRTLGAEHERGARERIGFDLRLHQRRQTARPFAEIDGLQRNRNPDTAARTDQELPFSARIIAATIAADAQAPRASRVQTASTALRDARSAVQSPGAICNSDLGSRRTVAQPLPRLPPVSPAPQTPSLFRHRSNDGAVPAPLELQPVSCIRLSGASKSVAQSRAAPAISPRSIPPNTRAARRRLRASDLHRLFDDRLRWSHHQPSCKKRVSMIYASIDVSEVHKIRRITSDFWGRLASQARKRRERSGREIPPQKPKKGERR